MALSKLVFKPGVNLDQTDYASEGGWREMDKVRFRSGFPEKLGGWQVKTFDPYVGAARSVITWNTTAGSDLIGVGTSSKVYVNASTSMNDITPIRQTFTTTATNNCFGTTNASTTVVVTITGHGATNGAYVTFSGAVGFAGIPTGNLNTEFEVGNVTPNTFTITVATSATSTVAAGGGTAITAAFQENVGFEISTAGFGWGTGSWGRDTWGSGSTSPIFFPARIVPMVNFNDDLIFNYSNGDIYYWVYTPSFSNRGVLLSSIAGAVAVPQRVSRIMFATTGHLLALGCTQYNALAAAPDYLGSYDPLMIRWANVDADIGPEPENWKPELTNTAGFLRLQAGGRIVGGINTRQETLVWTDVALYSIQFLGTAEVFGQQTLASSITIMSGNAMVGANNITYWMGADKFYTYSGRVDTLPCTLRQYIFEDVNRAQAELIFAGSNAQFNEVIWFYCSAQSNQINRYVIYNYSENIWYYGQLDRTAWVDAGVTELPIAVANSWVYQHENGTDDGQPLGAPPLPLNSFIQSADVDISDGDKFMLLRRIIPDVNFRGSLQSNPVTGAPLTPQVDMTVGVRNFPGAVSEISNASEQATERGVVTTATIDQYTNQVFVRARGRQMNFRISSDTVGTRWQLGMPRFDARPDGTRG